MTKEERETAIEQFKIAKSLIQQNGNDYLDERDIPIIDMAIEALEVEPQRLCKDCKWWKDSDGVYRRGIGAESRCPMNCKTVLEGNGYCFLFKPQKSEG